MLASWHGPAAGPPIVFLHGLLRNRGCCSPLFAVAGARHTVTAIDHAGHGASPRLDSYRVMDHLPGLLAYLREPAILYGHSMGAMLAALIAAERPELVRAVILEDPPMQTMGARLAGTALHGYFQMVQPLLGDATLTARGLAAAGVQREASQLRFMARSFRDVDPRVLDTVIAGQWLNGYDEARVWNRLACPALLLQGDEAAGGMLTDDDAAEARRRAADLSVVKLAGVGHQMHWQDAPAVTQHLLAFLESLT